VVLLEEIGGAGAGAAVEDAGEAVDLRNRTTTLSAGGSSAAEGVVGGIAAVTLLMECSPSLRLLALVGLCRRISSPARLTLSRPRSAACLLGKLPTLGGFLVQFLWVPQSLGLWRALRSQRVVRCAIDELAVLRPTTPPLVTMGQKRTSLYPMKMATRRFLMTSGPLYAWLAALLGSGGIGLVTGAARTHSGPWRRVVPSLGSCVSTPSVARRGMCESTACLVSGLCCVSLFRPMSVCMRSGRVDP
jgi:hypothetical protein